MSLREGIRAPCPPSFRWMAMCPMALRERGGDRGRPSDGRRRRPPGSAVFGLVLGRETLPLHVAPELLGHLGGADRRRSEQRFQAVRAALKADRVSSEGRLLTGVSLGHGEPPLRTLSSTLQPMTTTAGGHDKQKGPHLGGSGFGGRRR